MLAVYGKCGPHEHACHKGLVAALHDAGAMLVVNGLPADGPAPDIDELDNMDWYLNDLCIVGSPCWWHPDAHGAPYDSMRLAYIVLNPDGARVVGMEVDTISSPCDSCSWGIPHLAVDILGFVDLNLSQVIPEKFRKPKINAQKIWGEESSTKYD